MPKFTHPEVNDLQHTTYGFFTTEKGSSAGSYIISGEQTRNVNLMSPGQKLEQGYDAPENILANLQACHTELRKMLLPSLVDHKFIMTSNYAKGGVLIHECANLEQLKKLESDARASEGCLGLPAEMLKAIESSGDIFILKADALIFKGIDDHAIAFGGASGDAHPIILIDDDNRIAAYVSGTHACIASGGLEQVLDRMVKLGADPGKLKLIIGPGLGPNSYEFGDNAPSYFNAPVGPNEALTEVLDHEAKQRYLINMEQLVKHKLTGRITPENIYDMALNTMAFDLYDADRQRKTSINFSELESQGLLFFSARRAIMRMQDDVRAKNPGLHNAEGRHYAGIILR